MFLATAISAVEDDILEDTKKKEVKHQTMESALQLRDNQGFCAINKKPRSVICEIESERKWHLI